MANLSFDPKEIAPLLQKMGIGQAPDTSTPAPATPQMTQTPDLGQAPSTARPAVDAMPPPPMPPVPAQAGFNEWSADPQNQKMVAAGITQPGQPLVPPAASAQFGGVAPMASTPAPAAAAPTAAPATDPLAAPQAKLQTDQAELNRLQSTGSGASQIKNPLWRTVARIGDAAGTVLAPGVMSAIPGTTVHNWTLQNLKQGQVAGDQSSLQGIAQLADTQSQTNERNALGDKASALAANVPVTTQLKRNATLAQIAKSGQVGTYDEAGNLTVADDPNSQVFKSRQLKDQLLSAQVDDTNAQKALRDAQTAVENSKNDPNSPAYRLNLSKLAVARQNAAAASTRAQAYMGKYMQSAYNVGLDGQTLKGAPIISDDAGNQSVVGTANAGTAIKNQSGAAQFNDVHGALDSIERTAGDLVQSGGRLNSPGVVAALAAPHTSILSWMQSLDKANLTPQERAYVQSNIALHENIQGMRKSAGGGATDSQVENLLKMAPSASTPDLDYLKGQTGQIRSTAERLGKGAVVSTGGLTVRGQGNGTQPTAAAPAAPKPPATYKDTATGPGGHLIGSNDGQKTWYDVKTGKRVGN
jgi:hypothetical protein